MTSPRDFLRRRFGGSRGPLWKWAVLQYWRLADHVRAIEPPLFTQIRRLGPAPRNDGSGQRRKILFVSTRQERDQATITSVLAGALQARGHDTVAVHCDRVIPASCDTGSYPDLDPATCEMCYRFTRQVRTRTGLSTIWLSRLVTPDDWAAARAIVGEATDAEVPELEVEGLPIGELARHSVAHFLRSDEIEGDLEAMRVYRRWVIGGIVLARAWRRLLAEQHPDVIVMLSGYFMPERIAFEIAHAKGIRVVTYEIGTGAETLVFDHDHLIDYDLGWEWSTFRDVPLRPDEVARVEGRINERRTGGGHLVSYWQTRDEDRANIIRELALRPLPTAVLFTNLTWDSAVFGKNVMFPTMEAWVVHTIEWFRSHPDVQLILRIHPAEELYRSPHPLTEVILGRVGRLPPNVILVDSDSPISSYALAEIADLGLVYSSTIGMELPLIGRPVVVCGDVHYRGKGFTNDPTTIEEYEHMLGRLRDRSHPTLSDGEREMAFRYGHYFFFHLGVPLHFLRYGSTSQIPELRISSWAEVMRGQDVVLDRVCRAIVEGGSFLRD